MARVVAVVLAALMIAGALAYRNREEREATGGDGTIGLVCASELGSLCEAADLPASVELTVEPAAVTYDRLVGAAATVAEMDGWLVPGPYPTMVQEARQRAALPPLLGRSTVVGGARAAMVVWNDRAAAMRRSCGGEEITWRCVGDVAGRSSWDRSEGRSEWGLVKIGLAPPDEEAGGTIVLGAATAGFFESTELSSVDIAENDGYRGWVAGLAAHARTGADLARMLSGGPAALDLYLGLGPAMAPLVQEAARGAQASVIYPRPVAHAEVHLVAVGEGRRLPGDVTGEIEEQLSDAGWRAPGGGGTGLPSAGLLDALRTTWKEAAR